MDLSNLFNFKKKSVPEKKLFLSLLLSDSLVQSALWTIEADEILLIRKSDIKEYQDEEDCLVKVDQSFQELGAESEDVNEIVFGFDPSWVTHEGIKIEKKPFLKRLTQELSLKPMGFVVINEALLTFLVKTEPLLSVLIIYLEKNLLTVSLVKQGKLIKSSQLGRSADIQVDLVEALARLSAKITEEKLVPAKIILSSLTINKEELADIQQDLIAFNWSDYATLQTPVIDTFNRDRLLELITNEGGRAMAEAKGILYPVSPVTLATGMEPSSQETAFNQESQEIIDLDQPAAETAKSDLTDKEQKKNSVSTFGVPIGSDKAALLLKSDLKELNEKETFDLTDNLAATPSSFSFADSTSAFQFNLKKFSLKKRLILSGFGLGLLVTFLILYFLFLSLYQLEIFIKLKTIPISKEVTLTLDPNIEESDPAALVLKASLVKKELSDTAVANATGVKLTGEKAQGKVAIFNKTEDDITLKKGEILVYDNLKFVLNKEVKIAAASVKAQESGEGETKEYGQSEAEVEAVEIGAESNLTSGDELLVDDKEKSEMSAKVISDFTGGSSREIRVVSAEDREQLLTDLTKTLSEKAKQEFTTLANNHQHVIPTGQMEKIEVKYSAETDEEAENLTLNLTLNFTALSYSSADLRPIVEQLLKSAVPANYQLVDQDPEILSSPLDEGSNQAQTKTVVLEANLSSQAEPIIDEGNLISQLKGLPMAKVESTLKEQPTIEAVAYRFQPEFIKFLTNQAPKSEKRIILIRQSDQ